MNVESGEREQVNATAAFPGRLSTRISPAHHLQCFLHRSGSNVQARPRSHWRELSVTTTDESPVPRQAINAHFPSAPPAMLFAQVTIGDNTATIGDNTATRNNQRENTSRTSGRCWHII